MLLACVGVVILFAHSLLLVCADVQRIHTLCAAHFESMLLEILLKLNVVGTIKISRL